MNDHPTRPAWRTALRLLGALLLSAVAAEGVVRLAATRLPAVRLLAEPPGTRVDDPTSFAEFRRAFGEHLVPGRPWFDFRCNSLGFHDLEFSPVLPPGGFRIVALGDSFAYGNVPYGGAFLTVTEALLVLARRTEEGPASAPVEVDNLGVPASGLADYRLVYDFVARGLDPDLVLIVVYLGNDPLDFADASRFGESRGPWPRSWLATFLSRSFRLAVERWRGTGSAVAPPPAAAAAAGKPAARIWSDESPELSRKIFSDEAFAEIMRRELGVFAPPGSGLGPPDWDGFLDALGELVAHVEADGHRAVLVLAPSRLQVDAEELRAAAAGAGVPLSALDVDLPGRRIAGLARARGVPLIDTTARLRAETARGGRLYLPNDTHWNLHGNAVVADEVARRLVEGGFVAGATETPRWRAEAPAGEPSLLPTHATDER